MLSVLFWHSLALISFIIILLLSYIAVYIDVMESDSFRFNVEHELTTTEYNILIIVMMDHFERYIISA